MNGTITGCRFVTNSPFRKIKSLSLRAYVMVSGELRHAHLLNFVLALCVQTPTHTRPLPTRSNINREAIQSTWNHQYLSFPICLVDVSVLECFRGWTWSSARNSHSFYLFILQFFDWFFSVMFPDVYLINSCKFSTTADKLYVNFVCIMLRYFSIAPGSKMDV